MPSQLTTLSTPSWTPAGETEEGVYTVAITTGGDQVPVEVQVGVDSDDFGGSINGHYLIPPGWVRDRRLNNLGLSSVTVGVQDDNEVVFVRVSFHGADVGGAPQVLMTPSGIASGGAGEAPGDVRDLAYTRTETVASLSWSAPDPADGIPITDYDVSYRVASPPGSWVDVPHTGTATSRNVTGLTPGVPYNFRVRAVTPLPGGYVRTVNTIPLAPTGLAASIAATEVTITWTAGPDGGSPITGYQYRIDGGSWTTIAGSDATTTSVTLTGLVQGQTYTFELRAVNAIGGGVPSSQQQATPATVPDAPTGLAATNENAQSTLPWTEPDNGGSPITSYEYQQDGGAWTSIPGSGAGTTSYTVTGLTNEQTYAFAVRAVNAVGESAASASASATPTAFTVPDAPLLDEFLITSATQGVGAWFASPDDGGSPITSYEYRVDGGAWSSTTPQARDSTILGAYTQGTEYTFDVRAVNAIGESPVSVLARSVYPLDNVPISPQGFRLSSSAGAGSVTLQWVTPSDDPNPPTSFELSQDGGAFAAIAGSDGSTVTHTISGLTAGTTYAFGIRGVNATGPSSTSRYVYLTPT